MEKVAAYGDIQKLSHVFGVSRSGYYAYLKRKRKDRDAKAKKQVLQIYQRYEGKYGYRQLQLFLWQDHGIWMNHKKVVRLMQMLGIQSRIRRKRRFISSYAPTQRVAENRLKRNFTAEKPKQKWVTDITQYRVGERWVYLSAIKDLFNNEIMAYEISERNDNELVLRTFSKAFAKQKDVYKDMLPNGWRPNQHVSSRKLL
ncbi:IS3 family transposase [Paenibacillus ottowii]